MKFLIQKPNHSLGICWITLTNFLIKNNHLYKEVLISDITTEYQNYTPIGSVEFVEQFASQNNIVLPEPVSYPTSLKDYFLDRNLHIDVFENAHRTHFVKPVKTKLFTGGIKNTLTETIDPDTTVWICDPIDFSSEFRFYINNKTISGYSQYDDGDDYPVTPEILQFVNNVITRYTDQPIGYSIDVGITTTGAKLIEINDGWALGYYKWGTMTIENYLDLINQRWNEIVFKSPTLGFKNRNTIPTGPVLTEEEIVACLVEAECLGTIKLSYETGPYDITRPSLNATKLVRAIEKAHGIISKK